MAVAAIEVREAMFAVEAAEPVVAVWTVKDSEADEAVEAVEASAVVERRVRQGSQSVVAGDAVKAVAVIAPSAFARRSIHLMRSRRTMRS